MSDDGVEGVDAIVPVVSIRKGVEAPGVHLPDAREERSPLLRASRDLFLRAIERLGDARRDPGVDHALRGSCEGALDLLPRCTAASIDDRDVRQLGEEPALRLRICKDGANRFLGRVRDLLESSRGQAQGLGLAATARRRARRRPTPRSETCSSREASALGVSCERAPLPIECLPSSRGPASASRRGRPRPSRFAELEDGRVVVRAHVEERDLREADGVGEVTERHRWHPQGRLWSARRTEHLALRA